MNPRYGAVLGPCWRTLGAWCAALGMMLAGGGRVAMGALPVFDFADATVAAAWVLQHDLAEKIVSNEGMRVRITGSDPYLAGPARDYPAGKELWLNLRLRSDAGGTGQVFYWKVGSGPTEPDSVRFPVTAGGVTTVRVPVPALGTGYALRIDPPGETGTCTLIRLWFEERLRFAAPDWPVPVPPSLDSDAPRLVSGPLELRHQADLWGGFAASVDGVTLATGQTRPLVGYVVGGQARWWSLNDSAKTEARVDGGELRVTVEARDPDGATWRIVQRFAPGNREGTLRVETTADVDRDRAVLYFPAFTVFVAAPARGTSKQQAVLAGVEYLDDEPSSSEADLEGPQSRRQVTDTAKLTFPLGAVVAGGRYVGLTWDMQPEVAVVFDTPDRLFRSGGHVMGLILPGSDGLNRDEGSLVPYDTLTWTAGQSRRITARLLGGKGNDAVPVVRHYVELQPLPVVPVGPEAATAFHRLAARGWLDSQIRSGNLFRHATPGSFTAGPAVDAAFFCDWLAGRVEDAGLAARLRELSAGALAQVPSNRWYAAGVGHVRVPVAPLVYGNLLGNQSAAIQEGRGHLARFDSQGTIRYVRVPNGPDYGRTHWTNEANGLTAEVVSTCLQMAAFSGDRSLAEAALRQLKALEKFRGGVPRGAQTWEVPLHTPDILASAHLVRAYTLGYALSGDPAWLEGARYWAWTGVPFVYLRSPVAGRVGVYATTPVLGATQWVAPNWIGLPVQWCGLAYAEALYRLADVDAGGPWRRLADGITAAGVQMTYPETDAKYLGLLPDSFSLKAQQRNAANINPATLLACATRLFGDERVHDAVPFVHHGVLVQAAGAVRVVREDREGFAFRVEGWSNRPHRVLVTGLYDVVTVRIDGHEVPLVAPHSHVVLTGRLVLEVSGAPLIEISHAAKTALRVEAPRGAAVATLSWQDSVGGFVVEQTDALGGLADWRAVDAAGPSGSAGVVVVPMEGERRFFRLRRSGG